MEIFINLLYQLLFSVGIIAGFGLLLVLSQRIFCAIVGDKGYKILLATGIIGTPVHELSHAVMCLVFGHRIEEMRLYQPNDEDGTLGYVNHSFNERNWYQQIGNFFIGIAPILCGSGVLMLLMYWLVPDLFASFQLTLKGFTGQSSLSFDDFFAFLGVVLETLFAVENFGNILWWAFILLALMISSHMGLSGADVRNGLRGFFFFAAALLVVNISLYLVDNSLPYVITAAMTSFSLYIVGFLILAGIFSLLTILIALVIKLLTRR